MCFFSFTLQFSLSLFRIDLEPTFEENRRNSLLPLCRDVPACRLRQCRLKFQPLCTLQSATQPVTLSSGKVLQPAAFRFPLTSREFSLSLSLCSSYTLSLSRIRRGGVVVVVKRAYQQRRYRVCQGTCFQPTDWRRCFNRAVRLVVCLLFFSPPVSEARETPRVPSSDHKADAKSRFTAAAGNANGKHSPRRC